MDVSKISQGTINGNIENAKKYMNEQDIADCNEGLSYVDQNGDGKTSAIEMYKNWSNTCNWLFEGNEAFQTRGEELSIQIGEIYARYAGEDGALDAYEYNAALQSDEMGVLLEQYWEMANIVEAKENDVRGLGWYDSNNDGKTSAVDVYKSKSDLYSKVFENNEESKVKAEDIAQRQAEILSKFAGDDGVLSSEEFAEAVDSLEYKKTVREYMDLDM